MKKDKHIAILGMGPSLDEYTEITKLVGGRSKLFDEVWGINALGNIFDCDLIFHMDDVRIQEIRAAAAPDGHIAAMLKWMKTSKTPIVTSRAHPDYQALVEYPLEAVLNKLGHCYFNNTTPYAIAYAIFKGATIISIFGMDYTYANQHKAEKGRACVEFWLRCALDHGIKLNLPSTSTIMDNNLPQSARMYGYDTLDVKFEIVGDELKLGFTPRDTLPSAEEIEAAYDHAKPISQQGIRLVA